MPFLSVSGDLFVALVSENENLKYGLIFKFMV